MKGGISVSISREAWDYAWDIKRKTGNKKSIGKIISDVLMLNVRE